jgi:hypothetical protein
VAAVRDVASIRLNLARGRYRSPRLVRLLQDELRADVEGSIESAADTHEVAV